MDARLSSLAAIACLVACSKSDSPSKEYAAGEGILISGSTVSADFGTVARASDVAAHAAALASMPSEYVNASGDGMTGDLTIAGRIGIDRATPGALLDVGAGYTYSNTNAAAAQLLPRCACDVSPERADCGDPTVVTSISSFAPYPGGKCYDHWTLGSAGATEFSEQPGEGSASALMAFANGSVSVGGDLTVGQSLSAASMLNRGTPFFVGGDVDHFYAVVLEDPGWDYGPAEAEIVRSNVHVDASWHGSLILAVRWHSHGWGNGSDLLEYDLRQDRNTFVGRLAPYYYGTTLLVWLRGGTTYSLRSPNNRVHVAAVLGLDGGTCVYDPIADGVHDTTFDCRAVTSPDASVGEGTTTTLPFRVSPVQVAAGSDGGAAQKVVLACTAAERGQVRVLAPGGASDYLCGCLWLGGGTYEWRCLR